MIRYLTLAEYFWLAEQVTGVDANVLAKSSRSDLADSALHAPQAGFGEEEFYPDILDKAAVLICRLTWNHPLIDGNKRSAWAALVMFAELNEGIWDPDPPDVDQAEKAMLAIASHEVDEAWTAGGSVSGSVLVSRANARQFDYLILNSGHARSPTASSLTDSFDMTRRRGRANWSQRRQSVPFQM